MSGLEVEGVTIGDRTMIRRPWPCQCWSCWSGRPGGKTTRYVTHRIERERDGGEEGGNRAEMEMFVGFETSVELFDILHFILVLHKRSQHEFRDFVIAQLYLVQH